MEYTSVSFVWDFVFRSSAVFAIALAVNRLLHDRCAALRHAVWLIALASALAAPLISNLLPRSGLFFPVPSMFAEQGTAEAGSLLPVMLAVVYLAGCVPIAAMMICGRIYVRRIIKNASPLQRSDACDILEMILGRLGIRSGVGLLSSNHVAAPKAAGILRPVIILPEAAESWPVRVLESVLWHELAHIKRKDLLSRAVGQLLCGLNWFNPLTWLIFRRMLEAQESSCDDCVARNGMPVSEYASNLLMVAGGGMRYRHALAGLAHKRGLAKRLMSILRPGRDTSPLSPRSLAAVCIFTALILFPVVTLDFIAKYRLGPAVKAHSGQLDRVQTDGTERTAIDKAGTRESLKKGIEGDRLQILKRTEDTIYIAYTIGN